MLLVVDIGNSNITLGLYDGDELKKTFRFISDITLPETDYEEEFKRTFNDYKIDGCIISSVVEELNKRIINICQKLFGIKPLLLNHETDTGIVIDTENPSSVGADRIANVSIAYKMYKGPVIVVDIGTATTFDIVSKDGRFFGGVIIPGLRMQLKSLNINTSKLPQVEIKPSENAIGTDTESCILSGVIRGSAYAIKGLIEQCEKELGEKATIVATGGYSKLLAEYIPSVFDHINPNLTLDGLRDIYYRNCLVKEAWQVLYSLSPT